MTIDIENFKALKSATDLILKPNARFGVIQKIIDLKPTKNVLEIGVAGGSVFLNIKADIKWGVDPADPSPQIQDHLRPDTIRYFQMTSDDFFRKESKLLEKNKIDVGFVDGHHEYKQSLRDVENCLKHLSPNGVIIMDDCNPKSEGMASPVQNQVQWTGDVWKTIVHLRALRKDLQVFVLDLEYGLGVIKKGKATHNLNYSVGQIEKMNYEDLEKDRKRLLNLKPSTMFHFFLENLKKD